jgi:hypothetical protein
MSKKYRDISQNDDYKPKDFYKELAEYGLLDDFIKERMKTKSIDSPDFKEEIISDLLRYSEINIPQLDLLYLEKLTEHLDEFIEKAKACKIQKQ